MKLNENKTKMVIDQTTQFKTNMLLRANDGKWMASCRIYQTAGDGPNQLQISKVLARAAASTPGDALILLGKRVDEELGQAELGL